MNGRPSAGLLALWSSLSRIRRLVSALRTSWVETITKTQGHGYAESQRHPENLSASNGCTMSSLNPLSSSWNDRLVYTVAEAAQLLGVSRAFAYELVARGEIPVIRLGRRILIPKMRLLALLNLPPTEGEV